MLDLQHLDASQVRVVTEPRDVDVLCVAGPGSGKTRTMTSRIAYQCLVAGMDPQRVRAVTFTRMATEEMAARLGELSPALKAVRISTIHGLCRDVIGETQGALDGEYRAFRCYIEGNTAFSNRTPDHAVKIAFARYLQRLERGHPELYQKLRQQATRNVSRNFGRAVSFEQAMSESLLAVTARGNPTEIFQNYFASCKIAAHCSAYIPAAKVPSFSFDYARYVIPWLPVASEEQVFSGLADLYTDVLLEWEMFDYVDQAIFAHLGLLACPESTLSALQSQWDMLAVDEFQDVDAIQFEVFRLLCGHQTKLNVVGDPDQAIYGFRGGDAVYISNFHTYFSNAVVVKLANNYRSHAGIVDLAYTAVESIPQPHRAKGAAVKGEGGRVGVWEGALTRVESFTETGTVGLLSWTNKTLRETSEKLLRAGVICSVHTRWGSYLNIPQPVYRRVYQTLQALDMMTGDRAFDREVFLTAAQHFKGIGKAIEKVAGETLDELRHHPKIAGYVREVRRLEKLSVREKAIAVLGGSYFPQTDPLYVKTLSRLPDFQKPYAALKDSIRLNLYTIHRVKGLEFDTVFVDVSDFRKSYAYENVAESKRLLFVALSRAKENLFVLGRVSQGGEIVAPVLAEIQAQENASLESATTRKSSKAERNAEIHR